jgi:hypothetical protein
VLIDLEYKIIWILMTGEGQVFLRIEWGKKLNWNCWPICRSLWRVLTTVQFQNPRIIKKIHSIVLYLRRVRRISPDSASHGSRNSQ